VSALSRRRFVQGAGLTSLGLLAGCGRLPWEARQPSRVFRIGYLWPGSPDDVEQVSNREAFRQGLQDLGWVEGQNITVEYRFVEGRSERYPQLAAELVKLPVDVIVTAGTPAIQALKNATRSIPIIMAIAAGDPVQLGLIASLSHPGGNVTGLSALAPQLNGKRLELLKEVVPELTRVALLWNPSNPGGVPNVRETEAAAQTLGIQVQSVEVQRPTDVAAAFDALVRGHAEALLVPPEPLMGIIGPEVADRAAQHRVPTMFATISIARAGLMGYGVSNAALYRRAAYYVDRILKGANPADLPVEQPREFDFVINLKTAQALGLTIPQHVLLQATEIIQ
jgi:putative ABC transport system substrate-binding protein